MNKQKRNPFDAFETIVKRLSKAISVLVVGAALVVLLIVAPIVGVSNGWDPMRAWIGWILIGTFLITLLVVGFVLIPFKSWCKKKYEVARRAWEENNRG